ncbi:hypothetical protein BBW65_00525 [Helicobacter enhydrae]|uniref:MATE family efflux transporter n=1 Tax=Helicobacter enhydrae TaxID=222136 RepID=A0A1B1U3Q5_9HELI|nr:MATE family efflux transporter [Helicobacter enhydrae]ANV97393.1 hypothetical protein BBW65_00525 [Helicobacter enhydrae]
MTNTKIDLANAGIRGLFLYYFFPILFSMLVLSTHVVVDAFFVSYAIGQDGVAALGFSWPVFPVLVAIYLLFAVGGSALISYFLGKGEKQRALEIFSSILYFVGILGLILGGLLYIFTEEIAVFLTANKTINPMIKEYLVEYLEIIFAGVVLIFLHPILDMFAVNDRQPFLAMISMLIASVGNMLFNYLFLFVLNLGIQASAFSTLLGNVFAVSILLWHFLCKRGDLHFIKALKFEDIKKACRNGLPACVSELSTGVLMLLYIFKLLDLVQERGVLIYTIVMYIGTTLFAILLSIAQGVQPIASFNYGAGKIGRVKEVYFFGIKIAVIVSMVVYVGIFASAYWLAWAFLNQQDIAKDSMLIPDIALAMRIYLIAYLFMGINLVSAVFLQSIQRPSGSMLITLCYSVGFSTIFLEILTQYFGMIGVWATYPIAAFLTIFVVFWVIKREFERGVLYEGKDSTI